MSDIAIKVENLSKKYQIGKARSGSLRDTLAMQMGSFFSGHGKDAEFWALKDVSFEVKQGEVLGVIGRNGAGKSTLLKILSRITEPTTGRVELNGRVASLLEVGTGFHPELTGRENIFLNGALLGMTRQEIKSKFDEIVDFSGVEQFIDTPVKKYSSGMYVRLAFAVAAHLESEILLVDEVLAVGDLEFQRKCIGRITKLKESGKTVIFVSHELNSILNLTKKSILLSKAKIVIHDISNIVVNNYNKMFLQKEILLWVSKSTKLTPYINKAELKIKKTQPNIELKITLSINVPSVHNRIPPSFIAIDIINGSGTTICQAIPTIEPFITFDKSVINHNILIKLHGLIPDIYFLSFWIGPHNTNTIDSANEVLSFEILESPTSKRLYPHTLDHGFFVPFSMVL